ncbi:MAG: signal recognition particle-docking protein FtsY [Rhizobiaceae bacterium]
MAFGFIKKIFSFGKKQVEEVPAEGDPSVEAQEVEMKAPEAVEAAPAPAPAEPAPPPAPEPAPPAPEKAEPDPEPEPPEPEPEKPAPAKEPTPKETPKPAASAAERVSPPRPKPEPAKVEPEPSRSEPEPVAEKPAPAKKVPPKAPKPAPEKPRAKEEPKEKAKPDTAAEQPPAPLAPEPPAAEPEKAEPEPAAPEPAAPPKDGGTPAGKVTVAKSVERAAEAAPAPETEQPKSSWLQRLRSGLSRSSKELSTSISGVFTKRKLDEATLEELEDVLIRADLGAETAMRIADTLSASRYGRDVSDQEVRSVMATEIEKVLSPVAQALELDLSHKPHVILVVGVNGTGKTTTIGKLAAKLAGGGLSVTLAAGDTFRAAAIEQLKIWGERTNSPVVASKLGADAAGLAWDAYEQAKQAGSDVLIIDTAGRLQNKTELMSELEKIVRVLGKHDPQAPHTVLLTVDATTGQNALNQVEIFRNVAGVNGIVMTKLDGTARGGILVAIAAKHKLPVYFIGVGEQVDDLEPFSAHDFAAAIAGTE